jgi:hypothetical protein
MPWSVAQTTWVVEVDAVPARESTFFEETKVGWVVGDVMVMDPVPAGALGMSWTLAVAVLEGSPTLVAVMVTDCVALITGGAVYNPFDKVPTEGVMDQVTEVFALPVTSAVNCVLFEAVSAALRGLTPTLTPPPAGGTSVTAALADLVASATLVAVTVTSSGPLITEGAVYNPFTKLPIEGVMDQVTEVFAAPVTVAENCEVWDAVREALGGFTFTMTLPGGASWTVALADLEVSATLVAVMVTVCEPLITEGAVYNPFDKLPIEGVMDQATPVFALPVTVAVNSLLCDAVRVALKGLTPTLILGGGAPGSETVPVPPLAGIELPAAVEATTPVIWMGMDVVDGFAAIWNVATATVPSAIVVELKPSRRQPLTEHVTLLPAFIAEGPLTTVTPVMSEE